MAASADMVKQADALKAQGNELFKRGKYGAAADVYTGKRAAVQAWQTSVQQGCPRRNDRKTTAARNGSPAKARHAARGLLGLLA